MASVPWNYPLKFSIQNMQVFSCSFDRPLKRAQLKFLSKECRVFLVSKCTIVKCLSLANLDTQVT